MLRKLWIELRSSLWFVPGLLVLAAMALALGLVELDGRFAETLAARRWRPLLGAGAEGARGMLTAIAGSMISVAGMTFSITIVTLSLASTQYTPRILRNFMRDRANQFVLGIFVAIYAYCLVVLRTIRGATAHDAGVVPLLAVTGGMLLALLSIGCLIFFIHHVAASIQASSILKAITEETRAAIETNFPNGIGEDDEPPPPGAPSPETMWHPVAAASNGYVQHADLAGLLRFASDRDALVRIDCGPGDFAVAGAPVAWTSRKLDDEGVAALRAHFAIGDFRTVDQDIGFGIRQIVDIALKALSPGVNDTSTAVSCLDYLCVILCGIATRQLTSPYRDEKGDLRIIGSSVTFADHVARSFDEIRLCSEKNVTITLHLLATIARVARGTRHKDRRSVLLQHALLITESADQTTASDYDRARVSAELEKTRLALSASEETPPPLAAEGAPASWR